jgi:hypothetical protein
MLALKIIYYVIAAYNIYEPMIGIKSWNLKIQRGLDENIDELAGLRPVPHRGLW